MASLQLPRGGMIMTELPRISIYCPHCHRYTSLTAATREVSTGHGLFTVACAWDQYGTDVWWIGICNNCNEPVLVLNDGQWRLYPHPLPSPSDDRIPENIRKDLDEAKLCFSVSAQRASAVIARRAMQSACLDKGASKARLVDQLKELLDNGTITNELKKWADVVRWVGNDAAHPDGPEVTADDAEDILKLAEQFLHVLYVAPGIAEERMSKRKE